jgi:lipopolysaccharide biosynthesis regulator YciM
MAAALVLLLVGLGALAAGVLIGRYYVPDDRQLRRTARHSRAYMRALSELIARDHEAAIRELRSVVEDSVDDVEPYFALGAMFRSRGEHERAIRVHQALAVRERDRRKLRQRAMYELGLDFRAAGMPRRATRAMEEVVLEEPDHTAALRVLAALYEEQARFSEAAELWQRLGHRRGDDPGQREHHLWVAAAQAALGRGDLDSARHWLRTAQKLAETAHWFAASAELAAARSDHRTAAERLIQALVTEPGLAPQLWPQLAAALRGRDGEGGDDSDLLDPPIPSGRDPLAAPAVAQLAAPAVAQLAAPARSGTRDTIPQFATATTLDGLVDPLAGISSTAPPDRDARPEPATPAIEDTLAQPAPSLGGTPPAGHRVVDGAAPSIATLAGPAVAIDAAAQRAAASAAAAARAAAPRWTAADPARSRSLARALAEIEARTGPRLELALIRAELAAPGDGAALAGELATRFPGSLAAQVAAARRALISADPSAIRGALDALVSDRGALSWALRGRWQCAHCGDRPGPFSWRCAQCRRWDTLRVETSAAPPPAAPRERRAAPRAGRDHAAPQDPYDTPALPAATLDSGLRATELAAAGARRSLLGRVGGWVSGVLRRDVS